VKKDVIIYIEHIQQAIERIQGYTHGQTEAGFLSNTLIQDAVIRNLEVIGEAVKKLDDEFRQRYPEIEWKKIAGMRDKLIHDYMGVDLWMVWAVVQDILPELKTKIDGILGGSIA
jgi:uncharacterized protein with HEPN domain